MNRLTRGVLTCAALLCSAAAFAPAAGADVLTYVKDGNVWIANGDGSAGHPVTTGTGWRFPSVDDHGVVVALSKNGQVVRMRQDGAVLSSFVLNPDNGSGKGIGPYDLQVSPDGTQVAFAAGDLNGALAGGASPRSAGFPGFMHPFFQDVWLINADGSNLRRVAEVVERSLSLSWSPDGASIYAMGTEQFRRVDVASGAVTVLGEGAPQAGVFVYGPR
jgi:sugar lactone lactonase YvrE